MRAKSTPTRPAMQQFYKTGIAANRLRRSILWRKASKKMKVAVPFAVLIFLLSASAVFTQPRTETEPQPKSSRTLTVVSEPAAIVWLDEIRRGTTDPSGRLLLSNVASGAHNLRVRA